MGLTSEEERLARIVEAAMLGEDVRRIIITKAPRSVRGLMAYADIRLEDLLKTLSHSFSSPKYSIPRRQRRDS